MPVIINDTLSVHAPKPTDFRNMDFQSGVSVPYASIAAAISAIPQAYRYQYLTVLALAANNDPLEYWWRADTNDSSLEPKSKESYTINSNGSVTLNPPYLFKQIIVIPTSNLTSLMIGITSGGGELEPGANVAANTPYSLTLGQYIVSPTPIYFTGVASGTKILVYKQL